MFRRMHPYDGSGANINRSCHYTTGDKNDELVDASSRTALAVYEGCAEGVAVFLSFKKGKEVQN